MCTTTSGLFGEDPANRRERLRGLLSARLERGEQLQAQEDTMLTMELQVNCIIPSLSVVSLFQQVADEGVWFHEGPEQLLNARYWIADYSIPRCAMADWPVHVTEVALCVCVQG